MGEQSANDKYIPKKLLSIRNIVMAILTMATGICVFITMVTTSRLERKLKSQEYEIKEQEFHNELRFRIFEEVKRSIADSANYTSQEAVRVMIDLLLQDDTVFRNKMEEVLLASATTNLSVKQRIKNTKLFVQSEDSTFQTTEKTIEQDDNLEQSVEMSGQPMAVSSPAPSLSQIKIDVFYLDNASKTIVEKAQQIAQKLHLMNPSFLTQTRSLPSIVNAKPGYQIFSNEIRFEESERAYANEINKIIANMGTTIAKHVISYKTDQYVSVFIIE